MLFFDRNRFAFTVVDETTHKEIARDLTYKKEKLEELVAQRTTQLLESEMKFRFVVLYIASRSAYSY